MTMRTKSVLKVAIGAVALAALAAGCEKSSTAAGTGQVSVFLSDATGPGIQSATVWISRVYLIGGADSTGPHFTIDSTPTMYDLLTLQNGVTAALGTATIPVGSYEQLRFIVDSAQVTLAPGEHFADGSSTKSLTVPSGMQTGIKVNFATPVQVTPGQTILVADFSVSQSFVFTGPATAPTGVLFKPVIHAVVQDQAASISGTVAKANLPAKVYAIFQTNSDTLGIATPDTTGAYAIRFLTPGTYTVTAVGAGLNASKTLTLRAAEDTTGVNFP